MTERLYYSDATLRTFTAHVLEQRTLTAEDGTLRPAARLDRTTFYPTSGGQPHDTGTLNGIDVVEVAEDDRGEIWHILAEPLPLQSAAVTGTIDWRRRFDHMQQHTGQHILSAAFDERLDAPTVGFHLGREGSTIDLDIAALSWDAAADVEREVNRVVWENRPVTVHMVSDAQVAEMPLRKPPAVTGEIRVIQVQGYDASACGGTHVRATGEIGMIKVAGIERYKGGVRVSFQCGERALNDYQRAMGVLRASSLLLSVGVDELPEAIARLDDELRVTRRSLRHARSELVTYEATRMWGEAPVVADIHIITDMWVDRDFEEARALANQLRERPRTMILLAVAEDNAGGAPKGLRLVCAVSGDLAGRSDGAVIDAASVLRDVLGALGGRGGGSPAMAQGGAPYESPQEVRVAFRKALSRCGLDDVPGGDKVG